MSQLTEQVKEMRLCTDVEGGDSTAIVHSSVRIATEVCLERIRDEYFILSAQPGGTEYTLILETEPGWILEAVARSIIVGAEQNKIGRIYIEGPESWILGKAIGVLKKEAYIGKICDIKYKISSIKEQEADLNYEIEDVESEADILENEIANLEEDLAELKRKKADLEEDLAELKRKKEEAKQNRHDLKKQKKHIRKQLIKKRIKINTHSTVVQI